MLCHSVRSCHWPSLSLKRSFVAIENLATGMPPWVYFTSGSLPRFPIRMTLLTLFPAMNAAPSAPGQDASAVNKIRGWTPNISETKRPLTGKGGKNRRAGQNETDWRVSKTARKVPRPAEVRRFFGDYAFRPNPNQLRVDENCAHCGIISVMPAEADSLKPAGMV